MAIEHNTVESSQMCGLEVGLELEVEGKESCAED